MAGRDLSSNLARWLAALGELDHYQVLDLEASASSEDVQAAFHAFAERFHPDRHRALDDDLRSNVSLVFQRGAEAYRVLRSARLRADYDLELAKLGARSPAGQPGQPLPEAREPLRSLDELCRTAGGRLHARQAARAISEGDLAAAIQYLDKALLAEGPPHPELEERRRALQDLFDLSGEQLPANPM